MFGRAKRGPALFSTLAITSKGDCSAALAPAAPPKLVYCFS